MMTRWDEKRLESYSNLINAFDVYVSLAERVAVGRGIFAFGEAMEQAAGLEALGEANRKRGHVFGLFLLMGDAATIKAGRALQRSVWKLEDILRDARATSEDWRKAYRSYQEENDRFLVAARNSLGVSAEFRPRSADPPTWDRPTP
jgi:hypothetical protein